MRKSTLSILTTAALTTAALLTAPIPSTAHDGHGAPPGDAAPADDAFQKVTLNDFPGEPIDLVVLPDERVMHTTRQGEVWMNHPDGRNTLAAEFDVYLHDEEGLQSIAVDPGFGVTNDWVYLYYAPPMDTPQDDPATPDVNEGDSPEWGDPADFEPFKGVNRLSRFQLDGDTIDMASEQQILEVATDRGRCCHVGGDIVFDDHGNLYLSTGDDTDPFSSGGYTPIDERDGRNPAFDAQRSSANTNDLRGKVLRIHVNKDGSYRIPDGNLFEPGTPQTRPEIFLMGLRNPFRIEYNRTTDELYVADYSPDAGSADPERGPNGHGRWFVTQEAGNYGWPYCVMPDMPYIDYDFDTEESAEAFDCANPVNASPNNTGLTELPPVEAAEIWYAGAGSEEFPELGTGGVAPMAGPAYDYDHKATHGRAPVAWPKHFDGVPLFYEWTRHYIKGIHVGDGGEITAIEDVLGSMDFAGIIDMEFGPNGALYVLEYGTGYFEQNDEAQLARIDHIGPGGNHSPTPVVSADVTNTQETSLTVNFSSEGTTDVDGDRVKYAWDFDSDGTIDSRSANPTHTYEGVGAYHANLRVTDVQGRHRGRSASAEVVIVVGNSAPEVSFVTPQEGDSFTFGDRVAFEVEVSDDQPVDCSRVEVSYSVGHNTHDHGISTALGCTGSFVTSVPQGHDPETDDMRGVFTASYTDGGEGDLPELTGSHQVVLTPAE